MPRCSLTSLSFLLLLLAVVSRADQALADPFLGDWQGEGLVAQVIPRGGGSYRINFLAEFDVKRQPLAVVAGRVVDGVLRFDQDGWSGQAQGQQMAGTRPGNGQPEPFVLKPVRASVAERRRQAPGGRGRPVRRLGLRPVGSPQAKRGGCRDRVGVVRGFHAGRAGRPGNARRTLADHASGPSRISACTSSSVWR
jgi:hypothetical protein